MAYTANSNIIVTKEYDLKRLCNTDDIENSKVIVGTIGNCTVSECETNYQPSGGGTSDIDNSNQVSGDQVNGCRVLI